MPTMGMEKDTEQRRQSRYCVLAATASLCTGVVSLASLGLWGLNHGLNRMAGLTYWDRGVFLAFLLVSAAGGFAGLRSFLGIRAWRNALFIIPAALLGILLNGFIGLTCILNLLGLGAR